MSGWAELFNHDEEADDVAWDATGRNYGVQATDEWDDDSEQAAPEVSGQCQWLWQAEVEAATCCSFLHAVGQSMVLPTLVLYLTSRGVALVSKLDMQLSYVLALFALMQAVFGPLLCALGHRWSFKLALLLALLAGLLGDVLYLLLPGHSGFGWLLLLSRTSAGVASSLQAVAQSCVREHAAGPDRAAATGRVSLASVLGFCVGPFVGALSGKLLTPFQIDFGRAGAVVVDQLTFPALLSALLAVLCLLVVLLFTSFRSTTSHLRQLHSSGAHHADPPASDRLVSVFDRQLQRALVYQQLAEPSGVDVSGWRGAKSTRRRNAVVLLVVQGLLTFGVAAYEAVLLLYPHYYFATDVVVFELLFGCVAFAGFLGFAALLTARRCWHRPSTELVLFIAALLLLATANGLAIDPGQLSVPRFLAAVLLFAASFPVAIVECSSFYSLAVGEKLLPSSAYMALWFAVTGVARVLGPICCAVFFDLAGQNPIVIFSSILTISIVCTGLIATVANSILDRKRLSNVVGLVDILS